MWRIVVFSLFLVLSSTVVFAAPMTPRSVVNHQTRQCAMITPGDECGDAIIPPGWEYGEKSSSEGCPAGYTTIALNPKWFHFKTQNCCMEGHLGVSGDCQDVIINKSNKHCAFVDDILVCTDIPEGWELWSRNCPSGYTFIDNLTCSTDNNLPMPTQSSISEPIQTPAKGGLFGTLVQTDNPRESNNMFLYGLVLLFAISLIGMYFWIIRRR